MSGLVRSILSILVVIATVLGTVWVAATHLPGEARAADEVPLVTARAQEIQSIAFDGQDLPLAALRQTLHTEVGGYADAPTLERDRVALLATLAGQGFLAATVETPNVTFTPSGAFVVFAITQGPLFHLGDVTVTGPGVKDARVVTLAAGDVAQVDHLERARAALSQYLDRTVALAQTVNPTTATVDVQLVTR